MGKEDVCKIYRGGEDSLENTKASAVSSGATLLQNPSGWWATQPQLVQTQHGVRGESRSAHKVASWWAGAQQPPVSDLKEVPKSSVKVRMKNNRRHTFQKHQKIRQGHRLKDAQ